MNRKFQLNFFLFGKVIFVLWCCAFFNTTLAGNGPSKPKTEDKPPFSRPVTSFSGSGGAGSGRASVFASPEPSHVSEKRVKFGSISYDWSEVPEGEVRAPEPAPMMRGPMVSQALAHASAVTVHNCWPDSVSNKSIFYYLKGKGSSDSFSEFVRNCYKSSCALVFYNDEGQFSIIGSGSYLSDHKVATARHCVEPFSLERLYARFFDYDVDGYEIKGTYIDVPITRVENAEGGLDAAYLYLFPVDTSLFSRYARSLSIETDLGPGGDFATLPPGSYAMFHFARGVHHQVSIGHVPLSTIGAPLHNNIPISAWNGASGATIIQRNGLSGAIRGYGISIYRNSSDERRVIPFANFENPGWQDNISAPYSLINYALIRSCPYDKEGYEYLKWSFSFEGKGRTTRPGHGAYDLTPYEGLHQNHHIIPRGDLWFLWQYVSTSAREAIQAKVQREGLEARRLRIEFNSDERVRELLAIEERRYASLRGLLGALIPEDGPPDLACRFAWSYWNLFKGWKREHRSKSRPDNGIPDDPSLTTDTDQSEKHKPRGFNKDLWNALKDPRKGLYVAIQNLKTSSNDVPVPDTVLKQLEESLNCLRTKWISLDKEVYGFRVTDWAEDTEGRHYIV